MSAAELTLIFPRLLLPVLASSVLSLRLVQGCAKSSSLFRGLVSLSSSSTSSRTLREVGVVRTAWSTGASFFFFFLTSTLPPLDPNRPSFDRHLSTVLSQCVATVESSELTPLLESHRTFADDGLMKKRHMSGNEISITDDERWFKPGVNVDDVHIADRDG